MSKGNSLVLVIIEDLYSTYSFSFSCESADLWSLNEERFDERFGEPVTFNLVKLTQLPRRPMLLFSASEDSPGADNLLTVSKMSFSFKYYYIPYLL